jgi:hypothetical protein
MEVLMKYFSYAIVLVFLIAGCAKKQAVTEEAPIGETIFEEISGEEIDTSSIFFEETTPEETTSPSIFEELEEEEEPTPFVTEPVTQQGFRVQIGAFHSEAEADRAADRARGSLGRSVYVQYVAPWYKVRVGNFSNKYEATQYKNQLRSTTSYSGAWVVPSEIVVE